MSEFCIFDANKNGIWHIYCAQRRNLAYLLRKKTEFRLSTVNKLSDTLILTVNKPEILPFESLFIMICKNCKLFRNSEHFCITYAHAAPNAVFLYGTKRFLSLNSKPRPTRYHENIFIQFNFLRYVYHLTALF
jgi:hypothetical protein